MRLKDSLIAPRSKVIENFRTHSSKALYIQMLNSSFSFFRNVFYGKKNGQTFVQLLMNRRLLALFIIKKQGILIVEMPENDNNDCRYSNWRRAKSPREVDYIAEFVIDFLSSE